MGWHVAVTQLRPAKGMNEGQRDEMEVGMERRESAYRRKGNQETKTQTHTA